MAHSIVTFKDRAYLVRDDVLFLIIKRFGEYAHHKNIQWLSRASEEWAEHCDVMPPGTKKIELDRWLSGENERREILAAIDFISEQNKDENLMKLMHLDDLRVCIL